ncbi:unnamed protein product [Acanthoscelides obtectus]|uniref:Uncharacterized protein n=1 Tax=Acanthoscelides obtectus TaxID=200917 RepID=A0A9P0PWZ0_ACAOB|nr:unnamed protein product [Acanthoscelides obtectus]CAK1682302.1 hypothetical protein AOBTE_LOCUS33548 [Acanthoscelides obtectus]
MNEESGGMEPPSDTGQSNFITNSSSKSNNESQDNSPSSRIHLIIIGILICKKTQENVRSCEVCCMQAMSPAMFSCTSKQRPR